MSEKTAYILSAYGNAKAIIFASNEKELGQKTALAIEEEEAADEKTTTVKLGRLGDWGEDTTILAEYVNDGEKITNTDYTLTKTVSY